MQILSNVLPKDVLHYIVLPYYRKYISKEKHNELPIDMHYYTPVLYDGISLVLFNFFSKTKHKYIYYNIKKNKCKFLNEYLMRKKCKTVSYITKKHWILRCYDPDTPRTDQFILTNPFKKKGEDIEITMYDTEPRFYNIVCDDKYIYVLRKNVLEVYTLTGEHYKTIQFQGNSYLAGGYINQTCSSRNYLYVFNNGDIGNICNINCNVYSKRTFNKVNAWNFTCYNAHHACDYIFDSDFVYIVRRYSKKIKIHNALTFEYLYTITTEFKIDDIVAFDGSLCYLDNNIPYIYKIHKN